MDSLSLSLIVNGLSQIVNGLSLSLRLCKWTLSDREWTLSFPQIVQMDCSIILLEDTYPQYCRTTQFTDL
jgi:hypothetical protein